MFNYQDWSLPAELPTGSSPLSGTNLVALQQAPDSQLYSFLRSGIQGSVAAAAPLAALLTRQETQDYPQPRVLFAGAQGPNVRPAVRDALLVLQELPSHPASRFWSGIQGPNVRAPTRDTVLLSQAYPLDHPASRFWPGVSGPSTFVVRAPLIGRREQPSEIASLFSWLPPHAAATQAALFQALISRQEIPAATIASLFFAGMPPSGVVPPSGQITDYILRARRRGRR